MAPRSRIYPLLLASVLAVFLALGAQSTEGERQLKAAINAELVNGDLKASIKLYSQIAAKFRTDRAVAAMALVHLARCYQKMGDADANRIYGQVLKDYGDQKEAVAMARAGLGTSAGAAGLDNSLVWDGRGMVFASEGGLSPDGRFVVVPDRRTGDLLLHEIASGTDRKLSDAKDGYVSYAVISRDGGRIAYMWSPPRVNGQTSGPRGAELRAADLAGAWNPHSIYRESGVNWIKPFSWSPDGKSVVVKVARPDRTVQVVLVSAADSTSRVLKSLDADSSLGNLRFSPDGNYLAWEQHEDDSPEHGVFVLPLDGRPEFRAVPRGGHNMLMDWSPDGKWIVFTTDHTGNVADVRAVAFADGKVQGEPRLLKADIGADSWFVGMDRAGTLYYGTERGGGDSKVQVASFDSVTGRIVSPFDPMPESPDSSSRPAWSADGKQLAWFSSRGAARAQTQVVVIRSMDTGELRELKPKLTSFRWPSWTFDGQALLVVGSDSAGHNGVFRIDARSGGVSAVLLGTAGIIRAWRDANATDFYYRRILPEGNQVAFIRREFATGKETEVIRRDGMGGLNLSPDGRYIATVVSEASSDSSIVLLIPTTGDESREVMRIPAKEPSNPSLSQAIRGVMWAPDSRSFLVGKNFQDQKKNTEFWRISLDGGESRKLEAGVDRDFDEFHLSPDGRQIAYEGSVPTAVPSATELWALKNFLPKPAAASK